MNGNENEEMNTNYEVAFDLWPNYMERKFYDENEEIPIHDKKNNQEFNHLDFIGNKDEIEQKKIVDKDEEESEDEDNDDEEYNINEGYNNYHNINNDE